ncbi:hypothetical protein HKX48_006005 [Thoreauomyces humboldtii]|nr:hypothetical protein HKX48_006005 [Thoreauomyces humboldtii]
MAARGSQQQQEDGSWDNASDVEEHWPPVRSRAGTPVKTIRRDSTRSGGGLTPLPDIDDNDNDSPVIERSSPQSSEANAKIQMGLIKIQELDAILKAKNMVAKTLKRERLTRESSAASSRGGTGGSGPGPLTHDELRETDHDDSDSDGESDTESLELRSVNSMETRTFITEPKMATRVKVGIQALRHGGTSHDAARSAEATSDIGQPFTQTKPKSYKQGDFIQRNIVLGGEARYYSAMTEEESERVETLLQGLDGEDEEAMDLEDVESSADGTNNSNRNRPMSTASSAFFPDGGEHDRLVEIDRRLQLIIPEPEWDEKSIVWSQPTSATTSGWQTPVVTLSGGIGSARWAHATFMKSFSASSKDIETVLHDRDASTAPEIMWKDEQLRLQEIDGLLQELLEGGKR